MAREFYDEMYDGSGNCRSHYREFARWLAATPAEQLARRRQEADLLFHRAGITFTEARQRMRDLGRELLELGIAPDDAELDDDDRERSLAETFGIRFAA